MYKIVLPILLTLLTCSFSDAKHCQKIASLYMNANILDVASTQQSTSATITLQTTDSFMLFAPLLLPEFLKWTKIYVII